MKIDNEIQITARQLPDSIEDLSKFILIGRAKLTAVRDAIKRIKKIELAAEVHEQKLSEAQDIAEAVLDAETKLGELTSQMQKAQGFASIHPNGGENVKTKTQQLADLGITHAERYETLAKHPKQVEAAKAEARADGRIVTRSDVLMRIAPPKSHDQTMREFKKQARTEHEEFRQAAKEDVVDLKDIKRDKENLEIIALDISTTISKVLASVQTIGMIKEKEFDIMLDHLKPQARGDMIRKTQDAIRTLTHLERFLMQEVGRK